MKKSRLFLSAAASLGLFLIPDCGYAGTVSSANDDGGSGTLRKAILDAASGATIVINIPGAPQTIVLTNGELRIGRDLTIIGPAGTNQVVSGNGSNRVFNILAGNVAISGLDIVNGFAVGTTGPTTADDGGDGLGGGIFVSDTASLTLSNCDILGNGVLGGNGGTAGSTRAGSGYGGGIYNAGTLLVNDCAFATNSAMNGTGTVISGYGAGGAIANFGSLYITNCTITSNSAVGWPSGQQESSSPDSQSLGGGIYNKANFSLTSCILSGNHADAAGLAGGLYTDNSANGLVILANTIIADNQAASNLDVYGTNRAIVSLGFNLVGSTNGTSGWVHNDLVGSDAALLSANLGPLQNNGGPTLTMAPMPGSAAIGAGNGFGLTTDQRGSIRLPGNGDDIGAFQGPNLLLEITLSPGAQTAAQISWPYASASYFVQVTTAAGPPSRFFGLALQSFAPDAAAPGQVADGQWVTVNHPPNISNDKFVMFDRPRTNVTLWYRLKGPAFYPPTVTTTAATAVDHASATLNGSVESNDADTTAWFQYGTDTNNYSGSISAGSVSETDTNVENVAASVNGLSPGTLYYFRLVASNSGGSNYGDNLSFTTSNSIASALPVVVTLAATGVTSNSAMLNCTINPEGGEAIGWFFYSRTDFNDQTTPQTLTVTNYHSSNNFNQMVTGLTPGTSYTVSAAASNSLGIGYGAYLMFTTPLPAPPPPGVTTLGFDSVTATSANINGFVHPNGADTSYFFEYGVNPSNTVGTGTVDMGVNAASVAASLAGLAPNTTYFYRVDAGNSGGSSSGSFSSFTTLPNPPTVLTLTPTNVSQTHVTLRSLINPNMGNTTAHFEWGTTTSYGNTTSPDINVGNGASPVEEDLILTGAFTKGITYHYRIDASNPGGNSHDGDATFTPP